MNWKLRLQNKTTLLSLITMVIIIIYTVINLVKSYPNISPDELYYLGALIVEILVTLGIVVDPTTEGINDSKQAMDYTQPKKDVIK